MKKRINIKIKVISILFLFFIMIFSSTAFADVTVTGTVTNHGPSSQDPTQYEIKLDYDGDGHSDITVVVANNSVDPNEKALLDLSKEKEIPVIVVEEEYFLKKVELKQPSGIREHSLLKKYDTYRNKKIINSLLLRLYERLPKLYPIFSYFLEL